MHSKLEELRNLLHNPRDCSASVRVYCNTNTETWKFDDDMEILYRPNNLKYRLDIQKLEEDEEIYYKRKINICKCKCNKCNKCECSPGHSKEVIRIGIASFVHFAGEIRIKDDSDSNSFNNSDSSDNSDSDNNYDEYSLVSMFSS